MPLRQWVDFYKAVEVRRLRRDARLVGLMHPKSAQKAQRDLLRAAARISGQKPGLDLLGDPRKLRERLAGVARDLGVAVETAPADRGANPENGSAGTPPGTEIPESEA